MSRTNDVVGPFVEGSNGTAAAYTSPVSLSSLSFEPFDVVM